MFTGFAPIPRAEQLHHSHDLLLLRESSPECLKTKMTGQLSSLRKHWKEKGEGV